MSLAGPRPADTRALADESSCVCLYEHAGWRYAVVTGRNAQIKAVFKVTHAGGLRPLDWLQASVGPAALGILSTPAHLR